MDNALNRIKQYIDFKQLTVSLFEKEVGFSNGAFASQLKNNKTIGVDKLENILKKYEDINAHWLLTGKGEMLIKIGDQVQESPEPYYQKRAKHKLSKKEPIPVFDGNTQAGLVTVYSDDTTNMQIGTLNTDMFPGCDHAEKITGDSMYPIIISQGVAVGKKFEKEGIIYGEKYGIHTKYGLNVAKFLHKGSEPSMVKLVSYNKSIPEQEIPLDDITFCFRILFVINPT